MSLKEFKPYPYKYVYFAEGMLAESQLMCLLRGAGVSENIVTVRIHAGEETGARIPGLHVAVVFDKRKAMEAYRREHHDVINNEFGSGTINGRFSTRTYEHRMPSEKEAFLEAAQSVCLCTGFRGSSVCFVPTAEKEIVTIKIKVPCGGNRHLGAQKIRKFIAKTEEIMSEYRKISHPNPMP